MRLQRDYNLLPEPRIESGEPHGAGDSVGSRHAAIASPSTSSGL